MRRASALLALLVAAAGCSSPLPEPESTGARIYMARCGACHRLHQPGSMTPAMWDMQLERMHRLFDERGIPWPSPEEERTLVAYLHAHAGKQ